MIDVPFLLINRVTRPSVLFVCLTGLAREKLNATLSVWTVVGHVYSPTRAKCKNIVKMAMHE